MSYATENEFNRYAVSAIPYVDPLRVIRGWTETATSNQYIAEQTGDIQQLFASKANLGAAEANAAAVTSNGKWFYDSTTDTVYYFNDAADPNALTMEAGEDHATFMTWLLAEATKAINERLDAKFKIPINKDKDGLYPQVIIQATALMAAVIVTRDENADLSVAYMSQLIEPDALPGQGNGLIDELNRGTIKLPVAVDAHSASGEVSIVGVTGNMELVDSIGCYSGSPLYDEIKVICDTAGVWGTATFKVFKLNETTKVPKNELLLDSTLMETDYIDIGNGLRIRFNGPTNAAAVQNDEWQIAVYSGVMPETSPIISSIPMSRT